MPDVLTVGQAQRDIAEYERLVLARPSPDAVANLAARYFTIGDPEKALPLAQNAFKRAPASVEAGVNLAMILKDLGRHEESAEIIQQVFYLDPDNFYVRLAYCEALLKFGFWTQAWKLADHSRPTQIGAAQHLCVPSRIPEWLYQNIKPGQKLLVINEGGTGDRFNYPRWLFELDKRGIDWAFYPYDELFSFYERIFPREKLLKDNDGMNFHYWTTTFCLPARLNATPTSIPKPLPIVPDPRIRESVILNKPNDGIPTIGICWSAAELFQGDRKVRSMTDGQMMRLVTSTAYRVRWVSLQYGRKADYPVTNVNLKNWEETCAIIDQLDAVVSVDTGVAHLAGSMGKPMALLLSGNACWKFGRRGTKCRWYFNTKQYFNNSFGLDNSITKLVEDIRSGEFPKT
jgi:hypothetical protein